MSRLHMGKCENVSTSDYNKRLPDVTTFLKRMAIQIMARQVGLRVNEVLCFR